MKWYWIVNRKVTCLSLIGKSLKLVGWIKFMWWNIANIRQGYWFRSEPDETLFRVAGESGAQVSDVAIVDSINFEKDDDVTRAAGSDLPGPGRPVSANWSRKDGSSKLINFKYLIDSRRQGIVSTRYLKSRKFNQSLKTVVSWGYWKGAASYGIGTHNLLRDAERYRTSNIKLTNKCWHTEM